MSRTHVLLLIAGMLMATCVFADQITLKNGDRLTGEIVKSDEKILWIESQFAGDVAIQWAAVDTITSTQQLHVSLKDGQTIIGTATTSAAKIQLQTREAGQVMASMDSIVAIRSDKEQAAYDAELDRLRRPHLTDFWSGFLDLGLSATEGNSETLNFSLGAKAVRDAPSDKVTVYANSILAKNSTSGASVTTARATIGGVRGDLNLTPQLFVFGFTDFESDRFQKLDLRNVLGGGLGDHVWKREREIFDIFGGGAYDQAFYSTSVTLKSAEILAGEDFSYRFSGRSQVSETLQFFPNLSHTGQYRMTFDFSATTRLKDWLNWQISLGDRYVSDPIPGIKTNDLRLASGFRLTFGKGVL